jgi:molybdenum cofactor cytidylyltransferase
VSIAAVILAAGASRRLGEPKQLVRIGNETLLERAVRVAREADCSPIVVVTGAEYQRVLAGSSLHNVTNVVNDKWQEGMSSSIRCGVEALRSIVGDLEGMIVMACDQPSVSAGHLQRLMYTRDLRASGYAGRRGIPAFFPNEYFDVLMTLEGDKGARELLQSATFDMLPDGELDIDTVADLNRARQLFDHHQ